MSYEIVSDTTRECPCGKGLYRIVIKENDWFQRNKTFTMLCPHCKPLYKHIAGYEWDSGMQYESDGEWVMKDMVYTIDEVE